MEKKMTSSEKKNLYEILCSVCLFLRTIDGKSIKVILNISMCNHRLSKFEDFNSPKRADTDS